MTIFGARAYKGIKNSFIHSQASSRLVRSGQVGFDKLSSPGWSALSGNALSVYIITTMKQKAKDAPHASEREHPQSFVTHLADDNCKHAAQFLTCYLECSVHESVFSANALTSTYTIAGNWGTELEFPFIHP